MATVPDALASAPWYILPSRTPRWSKWAPTIMYLSFSSLEEPGSMPMTFLPIRFPPAVKLFVQVSPIFTRPISSNFLATHAAASVPPGVPSPRPWQRESERKPTCMPSLSAVMMLRAGTCIFIHEFWAWVLKLKNRVTMAANVTLVYFFIFFVCMRAINDYICKLA